MRCAEIVIGILNEPTRADHYYAAVHRAFNETRRMMVKNDTRYRKFYEDIFWYKKLLIKRRIGAKDKFEDDEKEYGAGPVNGFMTYAEEMVMKVELPKNMSS